MTPLTLKEKVKIARIKYAEKVRQDTVREVIERMDRCDDSYHCSCLDEFIDQLRSEYGIKEV